VFTEACRQARTWHDEGLDLEVAINLSLRQLLQPDLVADMVTAARRADVRPDRLVLEVGAASALGDANEIGATMHQLSAAGFRIAVDELGGWHPSLGRLRELPVSRVKIERTVVSAALDDAQAETMLTSIIALANRLDIPAVAVGIERVEELRFLVSLGCQLGQGYLLCRPVPADRISALCAGGPPISPLPAMQGGS
jgi:EAL domain-containing protein (putative c-di-GMP-specific phosphodiesterase class I)